jgi:Kdo2-lipid IVA lauroyltransferase/acyltransferase
MMIIIIKVFKGILDHYSEKLINAYGRFNAIRNLINNHVMYTNENILIEALNQRKGVILATGHFGGIELLPSIFAVKGYPVSIICRYQNKVFSRCIRERAEMVGIDIIETNNNNTINLALKSLKNGKILVVECDELNMKIKKNYILTNFLGKEIAYDRTIDILQKKSGAPVVFGLVKRNQNKNYELLFYNIINNKDTKLDIKPGKNCLKLLEKAIYSHPEQWYQWNKFGRILYS